MENQAKEIGGDQLSGGGIRGGETFLLLNSQ